MKVKKERHEEADMKPCSLILTEKQQINLNPTKGRRKHWTEQKHNNDYITLRAWSQDGITREVKKEKKRKEILKV